MRRGVILKIDMNKSRRWLFSGTIAVILLWLGIIIGVRGVSPHHIDDIFYKEPGVNWALTGKFISPALKGYGDVTPTYDKLFAVYPPLYPFCYGLWVHVWPHSLRSSIAFDVVIRLLLISWVFLGLPRLIKGLSDSVICLVALSVCFLGTWGRPDELAMVLGCWGMTLWVGSQARVSLALAGLCMACCAMTSPAGGLVVLIWGGAVWIAVLWEACDRSAWLKRLVAGSAIASGVLLGCLIPYYSRLGALQQNRYASQEFLVGVVKSIHAGSLVPWLQLWQSAFASYLFRVPLYMVLMALVLRALFIEKCLIPRACLVGGMLAQLLVAVCMPQQMYYYWFITPLLLAIVLSNVSIKSFQGGVLILALLIASNTVFRECIKAFILPKTQTIEASGEQAQRLIPSSATVLTDVRGYYVLQPHVRSLYVTDGYFATREAMQEAGWYVFSSYGLGEKGGVHMPAYWTHDARAVYVQRHFVEVFNGLDRSPPSIFGIPLGLQSAGYGVVVLKRRDEANAP